MNQIRSGKTNWKRTTRDKPCRLCGNQNGWCTESIDGDGIICGKTESASQRSDGRFYHQMGKSERLPDIRMRPTVIRKNPTQPIETDLKDFDAIQAEAIQSFTDSDLESLRVSQGLPGIKNLKALGAGRIGKFYSFPMREIRSERIVGIRLMNPNRSKFSVRGSKAGAFFCPGSMRSDYLIITEGFGDCLAVLEMGFLSTIGRSNCQGERDDLARFIRDNKVRKVILIPDPDTAGRRGAENLQRAIGDTCRQVLRIELPDGNDVRETVETKAGFDALFNQLLKVTG